MEKIVQSADKLLAAVPMNGDKTTIGMAMKLLLPVLMVKFPVLMLIAPVLDGLSSILIGAGLVHKGVKGMKARIDLKKPLR